MHLIYWIIFLVVKNKMNKINAPADQKEIRFDKENHWIYLMYYMYFI